MAERPFSMVSGKSLALAANSPLPAGDETSSLVLQELRPPYLSPHALTCPDSPRNSTIPGTPFSERSESGALLRYKDEEYHDAPGQEEPIPSPKSTRWRPWVIILFAFLLLIIFAVAVVVPVYFKIIKLRNNGASSEQHSASPSGTRTSTAGAPTASSSNPVQKDPVSGGDGSTIKLANGTSFTYKNNFGGAWYSDPDDPYNNNAYPNSWTPPLNQSWDYGKNRIFGVNLGGWFVLEPFITPAIFQRYPGAVDEWTLSELMAADTANGGLSQLEDHYKTFITEQDIAAIAAAGLNWVRIPIPYWAVDTWGDEPFLAKTSWKYIVQAFQWCRKYGIRVKLDLHTIPGSQSGYNHSGKLGSSGTINFLMGTMGIANAQRAMNYMHIIMEFISQPEWEDVVQVFGVINEARVAEIGKTELRSFYVELYDQLRGITGVGKGKGPVISLHDGFQGLASWADFMTGADRLAIDQHPYFAFDSSGNTAPIDTGVGSGAGGTWPGAACDRWASSYNTSRNTFGITFAGEWSNSFNDCGVFLVGVNGRPSSGNCPPWEDSSNWSAGSKAGVQAFAEATMDALRDWFFWTWKIDPTQSGIVGSPLWSYSLGLAEGWMPLDPRTAIGKCGPPSGSNFDGTFEPWMTGGAGAGVIPSSKTAQYPWPPTDLQGTPVADLPVYTSTGTVATLAEPTYMGVSGNAITPGNGWFNANDAQLAPTAISGCKYPDAWDAQGAAIPTGCTGGANAAVPAIITPPPS